MERKIFNMIENKLKKLGRKQGWPKNKEQLKQRIIDILQSIPKSWFKQTLRTLPETWKEFVRIHGEMTDYYIPKRRKII